MTNEEALIRIAERTLENRKQLKNSTTQRRTKFSDLYGIEYLRQGDAQNPATFYISVSPDFVYYERFSFKLQILPFVSTVSGIGGTGATTGDTTLTPDLQDTVSGTRLILGTPTVTPNPHNHGMSGGTVTHGIYHIPTTSTNWQMKIHGVDVTPYLIAQHSGAWITGEGIYPTNQLENKEDFYDILDVACTMDAEGRTSDVEKLLAPEFKKVEIVSDAPFQVAAILYMKYSMTNR